jgi:hypothetical protein
MDLLQSDVFPPPCEGSRRKTEGRPESRTDVSSAAAAQHTHIHTNTHAQVEEHQGQDDYERPTETGNFLTALNNLIKQGNMEGVALGARMTNDGEEGEVVGGKKAAAQGEDESEWRLCGGCQKPKARTDFATHEWEKADAWSREAARRCKECAPAGAQPSMGGDGQDSRPKRKAAVRIQQKGQEGFSEECEERRLEQVLCPRGCKCGNALAARGSPPLVQVVTGGGGALRAKGVMAVEHIAQGTIITCFGSSACVQMGPASEELQSLMNALEEGEGDRCQYTCAHNLQGQARFGPTKVWVVPPPDVTLILRQDPSDTLKKALKQRGPEGVGHFIDHSCCPRHINAELAVRWVSDRRDIATVVVIAKKPILPGEWVWVDYAPEDGTLAAWKKGFRAPAVGAGGFAATVSN